MKQLLFLLFQPLLQFLMEQLLLELVLRLLVGLESELDVGIGLAYQPHEIADRSYPRGNIRG